MYTCLRILTPDLLNVGWGGWLKRFSTFTALGGILALLWGGGRHVKKLSGSFNVGFMSARDCSSRRGKWPKHGKGRVFKASYSAQ